jgi:hypothetical protein
MSPHPTLPGDQHGWRGDPVADKLWLKGERLGLRDGRRIWKQLTLRIVSQAQAVGLFRHLYYTYVSPRVVGVYPGQTLGLGTSDPITISMSSR